MLRDNAIQFYREIGKKHIDVNDVSILAEVEELWSRIWENGDGYKKRAEQEEKQKDQRHQKREISQLVIRTAISNTKNGTSPGLGKIPNF